MKFYWRIWLSFWLVMVVLAILAAGTWFKITQAQSQSALFTSPQLASIQMAADAQLWLENGGKIEIWLAENQANAYGHLLIFDDYGAEISGKTLDLSAVASEQVASGFSEGFRLLLGPNDRLYTFLMLPYAEPGGIRWLALYGLPMLLIAGGLLSGVVSYFLARFFSDPLKQLQYAGAKIAEGYLAVDLSKLLVRKDEVGDLARDLDVMLGRLDSLLEKQKTLLRDISHELRSPLARLNVACDLGLNKHPESPHLRKVQEEVVNMEHLIAQLLTLTRLDAETQVVMVKTDLSALVGEIVAETQYEAQGSQVNIVAELEAEVYANLHGGLIASALENVLRNALSHIGDGDEILVSLRAADDIQIEVLDNGPGVPEVYVDKIFEPFVQVHAGRGHNKHSGLGLSIAKTSIELNQGQVFVSNRTDQSGLRVSIRLPLFCKLRD